MQNSVPTARVLQLVGSGAPTAPATQPSTALADDRVQVVRLVGRTFGLAAHGSDGSTPLLLVYDEAEVTPEDLVPFWAELERAIAEIEARRRPRPSLMPD